MATTALPAAVDLRLRAGRGTRPARFQDGTMVRLVGAGEDRFSGAPVVTTGAVWLVQRPSQIVAGTWSALDAVQVLDGWACDVETDEIGPYRARLEVAGPTPATAEITFTIGASALGAADLVEVGVSLPVLTNLATTAGAEAGAAAADGIIAPQVAQVDADAQAVEAARAQVDAINEALPGRVTNELAAKTPGAVQASVDQKVPAAVTAKLGTDVPPAVQAALATQVPPAVADAVAVPAAQARDAAALATNERIGAQAARTDATAAADLLRAAIVDMPPTGDVPAVVETLEAATGEIVRVVYADGSVAEGGLVTEPQADGSVRAHPGTATGGVTYRPDGVVALSSASIAGVQVDEVPTVEGLTEYTATADGAVLSYTTTDAFGVSMATAPADPPSNFSTITIAAGTIAGVGVSTGDVEGALETWERADGAVVAYMAEDGSLVSPASSGGTATVAGFLASEINAADQAARDYSLGLLGRERGFMTLAYQLMTFILYGQSLSDGTQGFPSLSRSPAFASNLMDGQSIHSSTISTWAPIGGGSVLNPLVATVYDNAGGIMSSEQQAQLAWSATNRGETVGEGAMRFLKQALSDRMGVLDAADRRFLLYSTGVGGKSVEELSKNGKTAAGESVPWYTRAVTAATRARSFGQNGGLTNSAAALIYNQGERNYDETYGCTILKDPYAALLRQLFADWRADIPVGIFGLPASRPAPIFLYQVSGPSAQDVNRLSISQAQLEIGSDPFVYLYGPSYPVPAGSGGVHKTSNGYRWLGNMLGKVMARVFLNGDRWKPLQPLTPVFRDGEVLIPFHVPVAPLVLDTPWSSVAPTAVPNSGIVLYDDAGTIPITAVEVVAPRVLRVKASVALDVARNPRLRVGGQTVAGRTGIRDSDPTLATDSYEYTAGSGQDPSENVAALVGKPYPLANWCALCDIPITKAA